MNRFLSSIAVILLMIPPALRVHAADEAFEIRAVRESSSDQTELKVFENRPLIVDKKAIVTTADIATATAVSDPDPGSGWRIRLKMTEAGGNAFDAFAEKNQGKQAAVLISGTVIMAPVLKSAHFGGVIEVSGNFSEVESKKIAASIEQKARSKKSP